MTEALHRTPPDKYLQLLEDNEMLPVGERSWARRGKGLALPGSGHGNIVLRGNWELSFTR
jgi:hypothetical protein